MRLNEINQSQNDDWNTKDYIYGLSPTSNKRNLQTSSCPLNTRYFPFIIGGSQTDCNCNIVLTESSFDANSIGQTLVAGQVSASSCSCQALTNGKSGVISFLAMFNDQGNYKWLNILENNSTIQIKAIALSTSGAYAVFQYAPVFRLAKIDITTGSQIIEMSGDQYFATGGMDAKRIILRIDHTTKDLYVTMKMKTDQFGYSDYEAIIIKLDQDLIVQWFYRVHGHTSNPVFEVLDLQVGQISDHIWFHSNFYIDTSNKMYALQKIQKSDGSILSEQQFSNDQPSTNLQSLIALNQNETLWYDVQYYTSNNYLSVLSGTTASNNLTKNYGSSSAFSYVSLAVQSTTGNFIVIGRYGSYNQFLLLEIDYNTGSYNKILQITKGSSSYSSILRSANYNGDIYIAINQGSYMTGITSGRLIIMKTSDDLQISIQSCINTTTTTLTTMQSNTVVNTTSATPLYTPSIETFTLIPLSTFSLILQTQTTYPLYTLRDTSGQQNCQLPLYPSKQALEYDFNTDVDITKNYAPITVSDCTGNTYPITALTGGLGNYVGGIIDYISSNSSINVLMSSAYIPSNAGDVSLRLTVSTPMGDRFVYIALRGFPMANQLRDQTTPNHSTTSCEDTIYPFSYGFDYTVTLDYFNMDQYGNILTAGSGIKEPFGRNNGIEYGYLSMTDQRGVPYWTYTLIFELDTSKSSNCMYISQQGLYVYAICRFSTYYFPNLGGFLHLLKLNHKNGAIVYAKKVPHDNYDPHNQVGLGIQSLSNDKVIAFFTANYYVPALSASRPNIQAIKFDEITQDIDYFKTYQYVNSLTCKSRVLIDVASDIFLHIRVQGTGKAVVFQGKISDGSVKLQQNLFDLDQVDNAPYPIFYDTDKVIIPLLDASTTTDKIRFHVLNKLTLAPVQTMQITFTTSYDFSQGTVAVISDSSLNIYVAVGSKQLYFAKILPNFAIDFQKIWTGNGDSNFNMDVRGLGIYNGNVFHSYSGRFNTALTLNGYMIFKNTGLDNCWDFTELTSINTSWFPTYQSSVTTSLLTPSQMTDISVDTPQNTDNYPLLYDSNTLTYRSYSYESTNVHLKMWGDTPVPNMYQRYPYTNVQCGMISIPKKYQAYNGIGTTYEFQKGTGTQYVTINNTLPLNCQERPFEAVIWSSTSDSTTLSTSLQSIFSISSSTQITVATDSAITPTATSFRVRYFDQKYESTGYYYDFGLLVRIYSANLTLSNSNISRCASNPFPFAYGQQQAGSTYSMYVNSMTADEADLSMYLVGNAGQDCTFTINQDGTDAYVMRVSQTGAVDWYNQIAFLIPSRNIETGWSVTVSNGFVYANIIQDSYTYNLNNVVIIKLTQIEGLLIWSKKLIPRNIIDKQDFYLNAFYDLMTNPKNQSLIMASALYSWNGGTGQVPGNIMIYDNGTTLQTLYQYQLKSIASQTALAAPGQIAYDQDTNHVYITSVAAISSASFSDITLMKLDSVTGSIVWSRIYSTNITSISNQLATAIQINNISKFIYLGLNYVSTSNLQLIKLDKNGGTLQRILVKTASTQYYQFDMAMNHQNGNIIIMGTTGTSSATAYFEIMTLTSDLQPIDSYKLHQSLKQKGRIAYLINDFFYIAYNTKYFSNSIDGSQVAVQKKSINNYETFKHECHPYAAQSSIYSLIGSYTLNNDSIPASAIYLNTESLVFQNDYYISLRQMGSYYSTQLQPQVDSYDALNIQGTVNTRTCAQNTGIQAATLELDPIEITTGQRVETIIKVADLFQCQNYPVTFSVKYEDGTGTKIKPYVTITNVNNTYVNITLDATNQPPYPGQRWLIGTATTTANSRSVEFVIPIIVWPLTKPNATKEQQSDTCPDNDQKFPLILANIGYQMFLYGSDIDLVNGNYIMCGYTTAPSLFVKEFTTVYQQSWISMIDSNGQYQWGYSATNIQNTHYTSYSSCGFSANQTGIFGMVLLPYTTVETYLYIVKHEYETGKVIYMRQVHGVYHYDLQLAFFQIDLQFNHVYMTTPRRDLGVYYTHFVTKIDINNTYPAQQYYIYSTQTGVASYLGVYSIYISRTQDYLLIQGKHSNSGVSYNTITKLSKSLGQRMATRSFANTNYDYSTTKFGLTSDDINAFYAYSTYNPWHLHVKKMNLNTLAVEGGTMQGAADTTYYGQTNLVTDSTFLYVYFHGSSTYNKFLSKFQKTTMTLVLSAYMNDRQQYFSPHINVVLFNNFLYIFYSAYGYVSTANNGVSVINQVTTTFQSPKSCMEWIQFTPQINQTSNTPSFDLSSSITFGTVYGENRYLPIQKYYYEFWEYPSRIRLFDAVYMKCFSQAPKLQQDLVDQLIQLPLSSPATYNVDFAETCPSNDVSFTWSIDKYSQTTDVAFITMTNTTNQITFTMNPTSTDIGSYVVRLKFFITSITAIFQEYTFTITVYPETNYGENNPTDFCPTSNLPVEFFEQGSSTEFIMGDMDSVGNNLLMCGRTNNPNLNKNSALYAGYLVSLTKGLMLNFHHTIETPYDTSMCYARYGYQDNIQSLYIYGYSSSTQDTILFFEHNQYGKLMIGKQLRSLSTVEVHDYKIDLTTGEQYITGMQYASFFSGQYSFNEGFLCRLDKDYELVQYSFFYIVGNHYSLRDLTFTSDSIYQLFMYANTWYYTGLKKISKTTGTIQWQKYLFDTRSAGGARKDTTNTYVTQGIVYTNDYLYIAFPYFSNHPSCCYNEVYFIQIDPNTGNRMQHSEFGLPQQSQGVNLARSPSTNYIVISISKLDWSYILFVDITNPTYVLKGNALQFDLGSSQFRRAFLFERNSMMWGFVRCVYTNNNQFGIFYKFKDYANGNWDAPCSRNQRFTTMIADWSVNNGAWNGFLVNNYWQDFPLVIQNWSHQQDLFYRWYGSAEKITIYPITNSTANKRQKRGSCEILANPSAPIVSDRIGPVINSNSGGFSVGSVNFTYILPSFYQCSGEAITVQARYKNGTTFASSNFLKYSQATGILYIAPTDNTYVGNYSIRYFANVTSTQSFSNYTDFNIEIIPNKAPNPKLTFLDPVTIYAHHNYNWTVVFDYDVEDDTPQFSAAILDNNMVDANISQSYLYINESDDTGITFSVINPPQPTTELRYIQIKVWDSYTVTTPNLYNISLTVKPNKAAYMKDTLNFIIPNINITKSFSYTIWYQNFTDDEGDQVLINCVQWTDSVGGFSWTNIAVNTTPSSGNITFYGNTPRNNDYAGNYEFRCTVKDQWDGTPNVYTFQLQVIAKDQINIVGIYDDLYVRLPDNITVNFLNASYDPLSEPNYYSLYINDTLYDPLVFQTWLKWNDSTLNITCVPYSNSQGGNHSISIRFDDNINPPKYINFTLQVKQNWPLIVLKDLNNKRGIVNNWFYFDYDKSEIFSNPENEPFTMYFRQKDSQNNLPYFISKNFSNGTIGGFTSEQDIGTYLIECVGIDDAYWETVIQFTLIIKSCYYKCDRCWESDYNTCTKCKPGFYFYNFECVDQCIQGTYHDSVNWQCLQCPYLCRTCTGPNTNQQCQSCNPGYFRLNTGCYTQCPDGYWGDKSDYNCKLCNSACSKCYGPSSLQCFNCTEISSINDVGEYSKTGYLLQGTECKIPKCVEGQYFKWFEGLVNGIATGKCDSCNPRCKRCIGPSTTDCTQCYPGAVLFHQQCTYCEEIPGYFTNEEFECEDICGDGIKLTKQCDDGNTNSGDGCSSNCQIEYGFACPIANTSCKEIIPPTFKITTITPKNLIYIEFSEPITIQLETDIGDENLVVEMTGSRASYIFNWRLINDPRNPLLPNRYITKFSIILSDFKQSLEGNEIIKISFKNYANIQDLAGNPLVLNMYSQINPYPFVYLSQDEANTASGGGSSLKYTFMSVFSFNIALKIVMNSSMQYLWGLVHSLQVFNFLLYLNIDFPDNIELFSKYLKVASGDIEELNQYIPNIADYLIDENNVQDAADTDKLPPKFRDDDNSPYFIIAFGQKLTLWCTGFLVILPLVLLLNKLCKKVRIWEEIKGSFFFNGPLRAFIEMYIELIMSVILNTQFVKFRNIDAIITTFTAFAFGAVSLLLPFLTMTLIYHQRRRLNKKEWMNKFGMLTEECSQKSILQLYYYPLFMYQRLIIAGIIVYVYDMPLLQCLLVITCNILMIAFLIIVKPFKEESQQTTTVLDEFVIMITVCLFIVLLKTQMTQDEKKDMGWGIILLILFSVSKNIGVVIYVGIIQTREKLNKLFSQEDRQKDTPNTSEGENEINDSIDEFDTDELMDEICQKQNQSHKTWDPFHKSVLSNQQTQHTFIQK